VGRTQLLVISLGAHAVIGAFLGGLPQKVRREIIAISVTDSKKAPEPPPPPPPPPPPEPVAVTEPRVQPQKAKAAPPKSAPVETPPEAPPAAADPVPDFGLSLSNGTGAASGGLAVPAGSPDGQGTGKGAARTLTRTLTRPVDDCTEQPTKPKALTRPMPAYPEAAKAAGIVGKVRVEITVDARGNVTQVRILEGLGHGLDEACLAAAKAMTFEPAQRCGKPTSATLKVGFAF
jgi:protein TonB